MCVDLDIFHENVIVILGKPISVEKDGFVSNQWQMHNIILLTICTSFTQV